MLPKAGNSGAVHRQDKYKIIFIFVFIGKKIRPRRDYFFPCPVFWETME
jgi:hypothetical protein